MNMRLRWVAACAVLSLGLYVGLDAEAQAAGCLSGAAMGGVAGHVVGHHALLGAAAGCAIGHHEANKQARAASTQNAAPANTSQQGQQK
jgi:hypothetical protein